MRQDDPGPYKAADEAGYTIFPVQSSDILKRQAGMVESICHHFLEKCDHALSFFFPVALKISLSAAEDINFAHLIYLPDLKNGL